MLHKYVQDYKEKKKKNFHWDNYRCHFLHQSQYATSVVMKNIVKFIVPLDLLIERFSVTNYKNLLYNDYALQHN